MPKKATPMQDGKTWWFRRRVLGQDFYVSGKKTKTAAEEAMDALVSEQMALGKPKSMGPRATIVAQALQDFGMERLKFRKGAPQDANRFNRYLRPAGLATLKVTKCGGCEEGAKEESETGKEPGKGKKAKNATTSKQYFVVELEEPSADRRVPRGLVGHRRQLAEGSAKSENIRAYVAGLAMSEVQTHMVQSLIDAMCEEGAEPATLRQEQALLRGLFNHERNSWHWAAPAKKPATTLKIPAIDNGHERVMSKNEQLRLDEAIQDCRNALTGARWDLSPPRQHAGHTARVQGSRPQPRTRQHGLLGLRRRPS